VSEVQFSNRILRRFAETVASELGGEQFNGMLSVANLPADWKNPETFRAMSPGDSAHVYAALQNAMRNYFGRGARGVLLRVGQRLWNHLLEDAGLGIKAQAAVIKRFPLATRRKPTLELLGKFIGPRVDDITIHTLDLDLLLIDHASPSTHDQQSASPVCFVTQGLIRESLFWSTGKAYDVDEIHCKAQGEHSCEFKITGG
jgi:predicted hydrocarbon binding protein